MTFKIINARSDKAEVVVSGLLQGNTQDEQDLLQIIDEEFKKIKTYNERVSVKDKQLVFKGVPVRLLKQTLSYLSNALSFDLKYELSKDFTGDKKVKVLLEKTL